MSARPTCSDCDAARSIGLQYCFGCWKDVSKPRPTGVPLTADNVADAETCVDAHGVRYMTLESGAWWCEAPSLACGYIGRDVMLTQAASRGTVVTKWRE